VVGIYGLQERIAELMLDGASLDQVESDVIEPSRFSEDQKAALWLYAWSYLGADHQRGHAGALIRATG
jgi:hypothetical protein